MKWWSILAVAGGGAVGALLRWGIAVGVQRSLPTVFFPVGTLAANLLGCTLIGACYVWLVERAGDATLRLAVLTGLIGALTTFSTYCLESMHLLDEKRYVAAAGNLVGSVVLGMLGVMAGMLIARRF